MGNESPAVYLRRSIAAANKLRAALEDKITGPFTVVPKTLPGGPLVIAYLSDGQSDELANAIKKDRSPNRQDWMTEFRFDIRNAKPIMEHWPMRRRQCPDKWWHNIDTEDLFQTMFAAYNHLEVCGK
jgi:hypothetical protein